MNKKKKAMVVLITTGIIIAVILITGLIIQAVYTVKDVEVEGNIHYTNEEIEEIVMDGFFGRNSLYLSAKYRNKGVEGIPFVEYMDVSILAPDRIKIKVYEKVFTGYIKYLDAFMYFDKDGYVIESSAVRTKGVPEILGLQFDRIILGELLPVDNPEVFQSILNITKLLGKYDMDCEKIYYNKSGEVTIYFGDVKVALGNDRTSEEDKVMLLPTLLPSLEGKSGTLYMTNYDEYNGRYTFMPD